MAAGQDEPRARGFDRLAHALASIAADVRIEP